MDWKHLLAYITGTVDQELLLRNEYLVTENRILRNQITGRVRLSDGERKALAVIGHKLGKQALKDLVTIVKPDTILAWHRKLVAQKFDGSQQRSAPGRPPVNPELEALVVRMAQENRSWGSDRLVGALANLGYTISDQTVGNILKRHSIPPAPERKKTVTWREFLRIHMAVLRATNFFTSEMWSGFELLISSLLCCIHFGRQQIHTADRILDQWRHAEHSFVLRAVNRHAQGQRWVYWIMTCTRPGAIRYDTGLQGILISTFTPD